MRQITGTESYFENFLHESYFEKLFHVIQRISAEIQGKGYLCVKKQKRKEQALSV